MLDSSLSSLLTTDAQQDLAGSLHSRSHAWQMQARINSLVNSYLSYEVLTDRLTDLPGQFEQPRPRPWTAIDWQAIDREQLIGIDLEVFLAIVAGSMETETPIRGYTQVSRQYLEPLHRPMAKFVGGTVAQDGSMEDLGLWEKEERQHAPALAKVYAQLAGKRWSAQPLNVKNYDPSGDPYEDLYRHGLHRVVTEYSAVCLYFWLMAHTTGPLQQVLAELAQDEVNHMTKFWGFGLWLFPESFGIRIRRTLCQLINPTRCLMKDVRRSGHQVGHLQSLQDLSRTLRRMMAVLSWETWPLIHKLELMFTFGRVFHRLWIWSNRLTPESLQQLFGQAPNETMFSSN